MLRQIHSGSLFIPISIAHAVPACTVRKIGKTTLNSEEQLGNQESFKVC